MNLGVGTLLIAAGIFLIWAVQKGYSKNFAAAWHVLKGDVQLSSGGGGASTSGLNPASLVTPHLQGLGSGVFSQGTSLV